MNDTKTKILQLLRTVNRPGMDAVIAYLESSNYFITTCYKHHLDPGGLAEHSYEVYTHMRAHARDIPMDSIIIAGLFHDLGKTVSRRDGFWGMHNRRSVQLLDKLGFQLTADERTAIGKHHGATAEDRKACRLLALVNRGDCLSTGAWKLAHPFRKHRK